MDSSKRETAIANMNFMGFSDEEKKYVLSDDLFIKLVADDPEHYDKAYVAMCLRMQNNQ